jgi:hypothetical protein
LLAAVAVLVSIGASLMTFLGRSSVVADRPLRYTTDLDRLEPAFAIAAIVVVVGAVVLPWLAGRTAGQADPQPSRAGLRHLRTRIGRRRFAGVTVAGVIAGLAGGLVVGSGVGLGSGLSVGLTFGVLYGVTGGAIVGTAFGIAVGLNRGLADAVTPGQIIRGDLLHGMTYGLLVGVASGVSGATAIGTTYGLAVGVGSALVYGMAIGPVASVRYAVAVTFSALGGRSPLRLHRFLKWASDAGILRVSGVVYQFRHRELQRWFEMTGPGADYRSADSGAQTADVRGVDGVHKAP